MLSNSAEPMKALSIRLYINTYLECGGSLDI